MMDMTLSFAVLRLMATLRAKSLVDAIALASVALASLVIGATVILA
jgi:hypothetical protein